MNIDSQFDCFADLVANYPVVTIEDALALTRRGDQAR